MEENRGSAGLNMELKEELTEVAEKRTDTSEEQKPALPDYVGLHRYIQKAAICATMLLLGIIMIIFSKGDIAVIAAAIGIMAVAFLLFRTVMKGIAEFKRTKAAWEESRRRKTAGDGQ